MSVASQPQAALVEGLIAQFGTAQYVLQKNLAGLSHDDSLTQPTPAGNCLNWVLGHIVLARNEALPMLGQQPIWDENTGEPYRRRGPGVTDRGQALTLEQLRAALDRSGELLVQGLKALSPERLGEKAPYSPVDDPDETVGSLLGKLAFHDAYHVGQTGLLRRIAGKPGAIA